MHRAAKITLGCLFAPVGLLVILLLVFGLFRAIGAPEPEMADQHVTQALPEQTRTVLRPRTLDPGLEDVGTPPAVHVDLGFDIGVFRVESGLQEEGIVVDAIYDEANYRLEKEYGLDDGLPTYRLRFGPKVHWLRLVLQDGQIDDQDMEQNEITVRLPAGVPIDLRVEMERGEGEVDLSGLALTNLVTKFGMGAYEVEMRDPNPVAMAEALFDVGMGEAQLDGLAHLRAGRLAIKGGMGEIRADLGSSLTRDTVLDCRMRMGELNLRVPDDALLDPESDVRATLGEVDDRGVRGRRIEDPELAHRLLLKARVALGEITVDDFRARSVDGRLDRR